MINWFKEFEERPAITKDKIPWEYTIELEIQGGYFVKEIKNLPTLEAADDNELIETAKFCGNLIDYIDQMRIMGYTSFPSVVENLFEKNFSNKSVLKDTQAKYFEKWIHNKSGLFEIGLNSYCVFDKKIYYFSLDQKWKLVDKESIFRVTPKFISGVDGEVTKKLDEFYKPSRYQKIYELWKNSSYDGKYFLAEDTIRNGITTPESVFEDTKNKINKIIAEPLSLKEIEKAIENDLDYIEYMIKISCLISDFAQQRRSKKELSLYLLRDCAMFNEAQYIIDKIKKRDTFHDQVYLGRQSLSSSSRDAGHWFLCQELLLMSLKDYPDDFEKFTKDFFDKLRDYEAYSLEFSKLVQNIANYLNNHIKEAIDNDLAVNVVDLGFQGSINMMVKYIIDNYCNNHKESKILVYVSAEWFKGVYKGMYESNSFSTLTDIEVLSRNNEIYSYLPWSLKDGGLEVEYGSKKSQEKANIELAILSMIIIILDENGLLDK